MPEDIGNETVETPMDAANVDTAPDASATDGNADSSESKAEKPVTETENTGAAKEAANEKTETDTDPEDLPVEDWKSVEFKFDEGVEWDKGVLESFGQIAQELKLSPRQMKSLAAWQTNLTAEYRKAQIDAGVAELKREWGRNAEANQKAALAFVHQIDRRIEAANPKLGDSAFSTAIAKSGAACDANFVRALHIMATMIGEDSIGGAHAGASVEKPETPEEFYKNAFK